MNVDLAVCIITHKRKNLLKFLHGGQLKNFDHLQKSKKILKFWSKIFPQPKYFQKWPFSFHLFRGHIDGWKGSNKKI